MRNCSSYVRNFYRDKNVTGLWPEQSLPRRRRFARREISANERVEIKEKSAEAGLAEASRKIDTSGGGTITRVTQAVSGGRHDGFKYFRPEARAPACPSWNYRSCSLQAEIESDVDVDVRGKAILTYFCSLEFHSREFYPNFLPPLDRCHVVRVLEKRVQLPLI